MIGLRSTGTGSITSPLSGFTLAQRSLNVFIDTALIGVLSETGNLWRFTYDAVWVQREDSFDICPNLPRSAIEHVDGASQRPVQWYFDNLLPEEKLRDVVAKEAGLKDAQDAFALLTYLGAESAGSLTLLPPEQSVPQDHGLQELTDQQLSVRIAQMPGDSLTKQAPKRMSVAGAQHKLLVVLLGEADIDPQLKSLRHTPEADAQGLYRFARGHYFFTHAKAAAAALNTPFNWALATVPNVEHSNQGMAPSALQHLLPLSSL